MTHPVPHTPLIHYYLALYEGMKGMREFLPAKFNELFGSSSDNKTARITYLPEDEITVRIGWKWSEKQLKVLYICFFKYGFITCKYEQFKPHFFGTENPKRKIVWLKYKANMIYIFMRLLDENAIPEDKKIASVLFEHFEVIEKGENGKKYLKEIPPESTKPVLSDFKKKDNIFFLDDIIDTVKDPLHPKIDLT